MKQSASVAVKQAGWAGTMEALQAVVNIMDRQIEPLRVSALATRDEQGARWVAAHQRRLDEARGPKVDIPRADGASAASDRIIARLEADVETAQRDMRKRRDELEDELLPEITWVEDGMTRKATAPAGEILSEVDRRVVTSLRIEIPRYSHPLNGAGITIRLSDALPALANVAGPDHTWVRGTKQMIEAELGKSRQAMAWLRADWMPFLLALVMGAVWGIAVEAQWNDDGLMIAAYAAGLVVTWPLATLLISRRMWPRLEILEPGGRQRAVAAWRLGASVLFQVVLALAFAFV